MLYYLPKIYTMKNYFLLLCILLGFNNCIKAQYAKALNYEWIKDTSLNYDEIKGFKNNVAVFVKDNKYGLIDDKGNEITTQLYDDLSRAEKNSELIIVKLNESYGIMNLSGQMIVKPIYEYCEVLNRLIIVVDKNNKSCLLSKDGLPMLDGLEFDKLKASENGIIVSYLDGEIGLINRIGAKLTDLESYSYVGVFKEGLARVKNEKGKYGFIDEKGNVKINLDYHKVLDFSNGLVQVQRNHRDRTWGYLDKNGTFMIDPLYDETKPFTDGCGIVRINEHWGIVGTNRDKPEIIPIIYKAIQPVKDGRFKVQHENGLWAIFDKSGKALTGFNYKSIDNEYINGLIKVTSVNDKKGALSKNGQEIISLVYDEVTLKDKNMVYVNQSGKWGCYDTLKQSISALEYGEIGFFSEGLAVVKNQHGYGYIDLKGKLVIQGDFQKATAFNNGIAVVQGENGKWGIIRFIEETPDVSNRIVFIEPNGAALIGRPYPIEVAAQKIKITVVMDAPISNEDCVLTFYCKDCTNQIPGKAGEGSIFDGEKIEDFYIHTYENVLRFEEEGTYYVRLDIYKNDKLKKQGKSMLVKYSRKKRDLYLIAIGTEPSDLKYTDEDARDVIQFFEKQEGKFYNNVHSYELIKEKAQASDIDSKLNLLNDAYQRNEINSDDIILFYFSGHGYLGDDETFYIQPHNFNASSLTKSAISLNEIYDKLNNIECKKLIIIDACKSGTNVADDDKGRPHAKDEQLIKMNEVIHKFGVIHNGWTLITSSGEEKSYEHSNYSNGIFTEALLQGLESFADKKNAIGENIGGNNDGYVEVQELFNYIKYRVKELSEAVNYPVQHPKMNTAEENRELKISKN